MPYISIIIPVYNTENHLVQCLDSIAEQSFGDYEVIMIDDGSTDRSGEICDEYAMKDPRFVVYHDANAGVATARNKGIELAKGEWLIFVDSDDWVDNTYLNDMVSYSKLKEEVDVVVNSKVRVNDEHDIKWNTLNRDIFTSADGVVTKLLHDEMPTSMWSYMFKRSCLHDVKVDPALHFYEDLDFVLQIFRHEHCLAVNTSGGYHYRQGSVTHKKLTAKTLTAFDMVDKQTASGLSDEESHYLNGKMILSVSFVGANDPQGDKEINRIIKKRAIDYCRKQINCGKSGKREFYIKLISYSPQIFYLIQRIKGKIYRVK